MYRVQYASDMLQQLVPAIRSKSLPPKDRLGLQSDLYALVSLATRCLPLPRVVVVVRSSMTVGSVSWLILDVCGVAGCLPGGKAVPFLLRIVCLPSPVQVFLSPDQRL